MKIKWKFKIPLENPKSVFEVQCMKIQKLVENLSNVSIWKIKYKNTQKRIFLKIKWKHKIPLGNPNYVFEILNTKIFKNMFLKSDENTKYP